uniref:ZP domain-containing protein n=1 Tax=Parascaris equorum TaxID=6256 RepID=A0A914S392_PAREQ
MEVCLVLLVLLCALSTTQSKVIGHYGDEQCHVDYRGKNETEPAIEISFDDCGMRRRRQVREND